MSADQVEAIVDRVRTRLGALEAALRGLDTLRGSGRNTSGTVVAQVDGRGALADLQIAESLLQRDAGSVAAEILAAVHDAARRAGADRARVIDELRESLA